VWGNEEENKRTPNCFNNSSVISFFSAFSFLSLSLSLAGSSTLCCWR
jgi:hypothetical protein